MDYAAGEVEVLGVLVGVFGGGHEEGGHTAVTTVLFCSKPLKISTLEPLSMASMRWPPVTLAYVMFVNKVGRN